MHTGPDKQRDSDARLTRDRDLDSGRTAVLLVDMQNSEITEELRLSHPAYYQHLRGTVIPNQKKLIEAARRNGVEVIYTVIESLTVDGRDRSLDHKLSGLHIAKGSDMARVIEDVRPVGDEIVLPKTSSGVFNSTTIAYVLRNIGIDTVIVAGLLTDQCVDMAVRDGADNGFYMICAEDACATYTRERHDNAVKAFSGYCRLSSTAAIVESVEASGHETRARHMLPNRRGTAPDE